jgi:hypothetical protein
MRASSARGLFLRAMRADPTSVEVITRARAWLSKRPRALESLLWRHLGGSPWRESREATGAALAALAELYEGPLWNPIRARAVANAHDLVAEAADAQNRAGAREGAEPDR